MKWKDAANRAEYLAKFQTNFYTIIQQQIDYYMTQIRTKNVLYDEILEHAIQCQILNERYFSRKEILDKVIIFYLLPYVVDGLNRLKHIFCPMSHNHASYLANQVRENHQIWLK